MTARITTYSDKLWPILDFTCYFLKSLYTGIGTIWENPNCEIFYDFMTIHRPIRKKIGPWKMAVLESPANHTDQLIF